MIRNIKIILVVIVSLLISCSKESLNDAQPKEASLTSESNATCGQPFEPGSYPGTGSFTYPSRTIDLTGVATGATVTIQCNPEEVPNKFYVDDVNGNPITYSDWLGTATYSGPWGPSVNNPGSRDITFTKGASNTYKLRVWTSTNGTQADAWSATLYCTVSGGPGSVCPGAGQCGKNLTDFTVKSGAQYYPDIPLDVQCATPNTTVTVRCDPAEVPNYFYILDANKNIVTSSGWIGIANYSGPWGPSVNNPNIVYLAFTKRTSNTYYLRIWTSPPSGIQDRWYAGITCRWSALNMITSLIFIRIIS